MQSLIIYGGSFDPIHQGHLQTALNVQNTFHFNRFVFLPCKMPVLKAPSVASTRQRIEMLQVALAPYPDFSIDLREINRETPSFMVETLESFRRERSEECSISLLMGMDAFIQLPRWHRWENLLDLANLLVMSRTVIGIQKLPDLLTSLLQSCEIKNPQELLHSSQGKILFFDAGDYPISSTELRKKMAAGEDVHPLLPPDVYRYIKAQGLYQ